MISWKKLKGETKRKLKSNARKALLLVKDTLGVLKEYFEIELPCTLTKRELMMKILIDNPRYLTNYEIYDMLSNPQKRVMNSKYFKSEWERSMVIRLDISIFLFRDMRNVVYYKDGKYCMRHMKEAIDAQIIADLAAEAEENEKVDE